MATKISNYDSVGKITGYIDSANSIIKQAKNDVSSSYNLIPSQIKNKIASLYDELGTLYTKILEKLDYASNGIVANVNSYKSFEAENNNQSLEEATINSISANNKFFWGYVSEHGSIPEILKLDYFENLAMKGIGTWDSENNKYILYNSKNNIKYEYCPTTMMLKIIDDNSPSNKQLQPIPVGFYKPSDVTDLSCSNTITFLHGDGMEENKYKYVYESYPNYKKYIDRVVRNKTNALVIVPQCPVGNKFLDLQDNIVHTTEFAQTFMQQKESCENNLIGVSSGGINSGDLGGSEGKDVYDKVVIVNGYVNFSNVGFKSDNLKDKEIIIFAADGDVRVNEKLSNSLELMYNNDFSNVQVITSDSKIAEQAKSYGFNTEYRDDNEFKNHTSMWYSIPNSGIIGYLGEN